MAWKNVRPDGNMVKWEAEGIELDGYYRGRRSGQFGGLGDLETEDGKFLTFPVTTALEHRLKDIKEGERIKIVYRGYRKTQKGIDFKFFDVFRWTDDEAEAPAE